MPASTSRRRICRIAAVALSSDRSSGSMIELNKWDRGGYFTFLFVEETPQQLCAAIRGCSTAADPD